MSLIENKNLNYLNRVEQFFLSLKESGVALSASDYHLIGQWESRGVPEPVLCRAIETTYIQFQKNSRRAQGKLSLTRLRDSIDEEIRQAAK